jgi:DNA-binding response OmpR family regulator
VTQAEAVRVLVVDDNVDVAETLGLYLDQMGYSTRLAHDGEEALRAAAEFRPQVALLDLGLPDFDGYEVAIAIREETWGKDVLICAVTAWADEADRELTRVAGFDHHFVKPVDLQALLRAICDAHAR